MMHMVIKFIYSEKATKFCEIFPVDFDRYYIGRTNLRWRFRKNVWPSQNIWTLKSKRGHWE